MDKYATFGIKKFSSRTLQYEPKLFVNNELVPTVKSGESFKYLGRYFKEKLESSLSEMLKRIDALPILTKKQNTSLSAFHPFKIILALHSSTIVKNVGNSKS